MIRRISKPFTIATLTLIALIVYLFVTAPPELVENATQRKTVSIESVFAMVEVENDVVRALWTKEIVGAGKEVGLAFDEDWREIGVHAGPLPALFLRETALSLEKNPVRLSLYLGSDFPISDANKFTGTQLEKFQLIKELQESQFFYSQDTELYTAMFSDTAVAQPCVTCHNDHKQSPKRDWELGDVMGATTWLYPTESVTMEELVEILAALRVGFRDAYTAYLRKTETFPNPPEIGEKWPRDGYFLPNTDVFLAAASETASSSTIESILKLNETSNLVDGNSTP